MKNQALFSSKDKSKKLKCRLQQFLFGPLRVKPKLTLTCDSTFTTSALLSVIMDCSEASVTKSVVVSVI